MNALCAHERRIFLSSGLETDFVCKYVFLATVVSVSRIDGCEGGEGGGGGRERTII